MQPSVLPRIQLTHICTGATSLIHISMFDKQALKHSCKAETVTHVSCCRSPSMLHMLHYCAYLMQWCLQGPLSRFGDTAANAGTLSLLESYEATASLNVGLKTVVASAAAASFRILLMPIDATKTIMQVPLCFSQPLLTMAQLSAGLPVAQHTSCHAPAFTTCSLVHQCSSTVP